MFKIKREIKIDGLYFYYLGTCCLLISKTWANLDYLRVYAKPEILKSAKDFCVANINKWSVRPLIITLVNKVYSSLTQILLKISVTNCIFKNVIFWF